MSQESFQIRFQRLFVESFNHDPSTIDPQSRLTQLGSSSVVDDFFDELESEFSIDIEEHHRASIITLQQAWQWTHQAAEAVRNAEEEEEAREAADALARPATNSFGWQERLTSFQRFLLKISNVVGIVLFIVGVQFQVRKMYPKIAPILMGGGMFIAASMFWGLKSMYNSLEARNAKILYSPEGYQRLFWILVVLVYALDGLGMAIAFRVLGIDP